MGFPSKSSNNKNKLEKVISLSIGTGIPFSSFFAPTALLPFRGISEPIRQALTGLEERRSNDGWWSKCIEQVGFHLPTAGDWANQSWDLFGNLRMERVLETRQNGWLVAKKQDNLQFTCPSLKQPQINKSRDSPGSPSQKNKTGVQLPTIKIYCDSLLRGVNQGSR